MVVFGVSSGCSIFISQFWGQEDFKGIRKTFGIMLIVCVFVSLAFTVAGIFKPEFLIGLYTRDSVVIQKASEYSRDKSSDTIQRFVDTYVTKETFHLSSIGQQALSTLWTACRNA